MNFPDAVALVKFLAMTMLDQISQALGASEALGPLANALGTSDSDTESLLGAALPAVLSRLGQLTANEESATALHGVTNDDGGNLADNLGAFLESGPQPELASELVSAIFGSQRSSVEQDLNASTGLGLSSVTRFLPMVAPAVLSLLGRFGSEQSADAAGLGAMLADDSASGTGAADDEDQATFVTGLASLQDSGGLDALVPGDAAAQTADPGEDEDDEDDEDYHEPSGLGWLLPTFAVFGLMILGLVLWQGSDSSEEALALSPQAAEGQSIAGSYGCSVCHGELGEGVIGPSWQGLYLSDVELEGNVTVLANEEYILRSITDPEAEIVAGFTTKMPRSKLTDDQLASLVAYLKEL